MTDVRNIEKRRKRQILRAGKQGQGKDFDVKNPFGREYRITCSCPHREYDLKAYPKRKERRQKESEKKRRLKYEAKKRKLNKEEKPLTEEDKKEIASLVDSIPIPELDVPPQVIV